MADSDVRAKLVKRFDEQTLRRADRERFLSMIEEATGADRFLAEWLLWNETPYPFGQDTDEVSDAIAALVPLANGPAADGRGNDG